MPAPIVTALIDPTWQLYSHGQTISYSFLSTLPADYPSASLTDQQKWLTGFASFSPAQRLAVRKIFDMIESITTLRFVEGADSGTPEIRFGNTAQTTSGAVNYRVELSNPLTGLPQPINDVFMSTRQLGSSLPVNQDTTSTVLGNYGFVTLMHEIEHALGIKHPDDALRIGAFTDPLITRANAVIANGDAKYSTGIHGITPLAYDVAALRALYGSNASFAGGNDTYTLNPGSPLNQLDLSGLQQNEIFVDQRRTLWDAGGIDTLVASRYTTGVKLSLIEGSFSSLGANANLLSIAFDTVIENAIGGSGNDHITGNDTANTLKGGDGVDILNGLGGIDILEGGIGKDTLDGGDQDDTLDGGENDDTLKGGAGTDTYKFTGSWGKDTIIDSDGLGKIEIDGAVLPTGAARAIPQSGKQGWMLDTPSGPLVLQIIDAADGSKSLWINKLVGNKVDSANRITINNNFDLAAVGALDEVDAALTQCKHTSTVQNNYKKWSCLRMYLKGCRSKRRKNLSAEEVRA
jgi:Ca2+-binding RTX toxin-like protein